jgi:hypothetical protein
MNGVFKRGPDCVNDVGPRSGEPKAVVPAAQNGTH